MLSMALPGQHDDLFATHLRLPGWYCRSGLGLGVAVADVVRRAVGTGAGVVAGPKVGEVLLPARYETPILVVVNVGIAQAAVGLGGGLVEIVAVGIVEARRWRRPAR